MKRIIVLTYFGFILTGSLFSNYVDSTTAKTVAVNFIKRRFEQQPISKSIQSSSIFLAHTELVDIKSNQSKGDSGVPAYYVFNLIDSSGFIIVSGDDRAHPILGYSDNNSFLIN